MIIILSGLKDRYKKEMSFWENQLKLKDVDYTTDYYKILGIIEGFKKSIKIIDEEVVYLSSQLKGSDR